MAGRETLSSHREKPASHRKVLSHRKEPASRRGERPRPFASLRQLSNRTPLRTKLITALLALVIMALAAISVTSVFVLRSYVYTQRDNDLRNTLGPVLHQISRNEELTGSSSSGITASLNISIPQGSGPILAFQQPGSQLVVGVPVNSPKGMGHPAQSVPELPAGNWASSTSPVFMNLPGQTGGDTWRVLALGDVQVTDVATNTEQTVTVLAAVDLSDVGAEIQRLITVEMIVGSAIVLVLAVVGVGVVRANLRPLDDIEMIAGEIAKGHLDHRIPERDSRTEIGSLGRSLNVMLTQIETAFHAQQESERAAHESEERMRRFIADASHELRTPLTTIRGFAAHFRQRGGVSRLRSRVPSPRGAGIGGEEHSAGSSYFPRSTAAADGLSPDDIDHLMGRIESESTRMGLLVEDLLLLARLDQQRPLSKGPVDLLTLAADAVQDARIVSPGRPIDLKVAPGTAFIVDGDEARLRQVLANLVNNAITHTPAGTPVRVKIARGSLEARRADGPGGPAGTPGLAGQDDWGGPAGAAGTPYASMAGGRLVPAVVLDIEDDGPGMSADQAQRVFERFYRADAARNRASGGTGLGLAIVAGLVSAHGGTVSVRTAPGQGADFQVKLPLSPDALITDDSDYDDPSA